MLWNQKAIFTVPHVSLKSFVHHSICKISYLGDNNYFPTFLHKENYNPKLPWWIIKAKVFQDSISLFLQSSPDVDLWSIPWAPLIQNTNSLYKFSSSMNFLYFSAFTPFQVFNQNIDDISQLSSHLCEDKTIIDDTFKLLKIWIHLSIRFNQNWWLC